MIIYGAKKDDQISILSYLIGLSTLKVFYKNMQCKKQGCPIQVRSF